VSANNKAISFLMMIPLLTGCMPNASDTLAVEQPKNRPSRNMTNFSQAMECMDGLFVKYGRSGHDIASTDISDKTGKLTLGGRDMLINAIAKMSRNSQAFRYLDYETASASDKTDTVQNMTNLIGTGKFHVPEVYIHGSISQLNDSAVTASQGGSVDLSQINVGANRDTSISTITMDLQLFNMASHALLPGMSASNVIAVTRNGEGVDVGAKIQKAGISFQFSDVESESSGQAVRNLVELGTIELLGKWMQVPYWDCLNIDSTNPMAKSEIKAWYEGMNQEDKIKFFKSGLNHFGYYKGAIDGNVDEELKTALSQYQTDKGLIPNGVENFETYASLINSGAGFTQLSKQEPSSSQNLFSAPRQMEVNIVTRENGLFKIGDNIDVNVSMSEKGYLHCYYKDEEGTIAMIYPNLSQQANAISGNQAIKIAAPIQITGRGSNEFLCMAANDDLESHLPAYLRVQPFTPIPNTGSLDKILSDVKAKTQGLTFGFSKKKIVVNN